MEETIMKQSNMRHRKVVVRILLLAFFIILAALILLPLYAMLMASFRPGSDLVRYGLNLNLNIPQMNLDNYIFLFTGEHDYFTWLGNSLFMTVLQVFLTLLISSLVGYGLSAYNFKGKRIVFICVMLILMVPFEILMLPLYTQSINLHLIDTRAGGMLPFLANAMTIFFFQQYIGGIPKEIIDSGRVDGSTEYGIFFKLIMPIMKPAIASMAILNCMNRWNDLLWPLLVFKSQDKFTLPIGLNTLLTPYGNNYDLLVVGSVFSIIPIFILFLCFQRYFIEGMTAGSVKG